MTKITPASCLRLKAALQATKIPRTNRRTNAVLNYDQKSLDVSSSAFDNAYLSDSAIICRAEYELQIKFYDLLSGIATKHKIRLASVAHMFTSVKDC